MWRQHKRLETSPTKTKKNFALNAHSDSGNTGLDKRDVAAEVVVAAKVYEEDKEDKDEEVGASVCAGATAEDSVRWLMEAWGLHTRHFDDPQQQQKTHIKDVRGLWAW
jgi:hypothetical protein